MPDPANQPGEVQPDTLDPDMPSRERLKRAIRYVLRVVADRERRASAAGAGVSGAGDAEETGRRD